MIQLTRDRTAGVVPVGFTAPGMAKTARDLLDLHLVGDKPKSSVWKAAKGRLKAESAGKCGYCEGKASHVAHGDVEHFRPKDIYWWLAYCYDNYVYSCQICNQSFKSTHFPHTAAMLAAPQIPAGATSAQLDAIASAMFPDPLDAVAVAAFEAAAKAELPDLPDPYGDDPEPLFLWEADDALREVRILPRDQQAVPAHAAVETFLGLNREELRLWRYEIYDVASMFIEIVESAQVPQQLRSDCETRLTRMMSTDGEFAAMVRYFVRTVHNLNL